MTISCQHLTFLCRWIREARLPDYAGSTLRGAFGWALKKSSCALRRQDCQSCLLRQRCAYAWIFETERYGDGSGHTVNARPHPFVLQPGKGCNGSFRAGETWDFSMLVIGGGVEFLPHIVYAVKLMGASGIGAGSGNGLGRFELEQVVSGTERIYDSSGLLSQDRGQVTRLQLGEICENVEGTGLRVRFHTPLRFKYNNDLQRDLPFHVLVRACLRRISALEQAYGQGEPELDYSGLILRAEQVRTTSSSLHWDERLRYSNRQKQKTSLSGLVGTIDYQGEVEEFFPLLDYCSQVHIGKQTVFGLGRMNVQSLPAAELDENQPYGDVNG